MRRHDALHPLSRDHHNALVHARRLRGLDARFGPEAARQRFLSYWPTLELHFGEEEIVLGPLVGDAALRQRLFGEHADLRRRAGSLATAPPEEQVALGEALRQHVRFEEDVLFPHLESVLGEAGWAAVASGGAAYRARARPTSLAGDEACFL